MPRDTPDNTKRKLEEALTRLEHTKRQLEQLTVRNKQAQRKADARRKIIAGAVVLRAADSNPEFKEMLWKLLDKSVTANRDRVMFDLPAKEKPPKEAEG